MSKLRINIIDTILLDNKYIWRSNIYEVAIDHYSVRWKIRLNMWSQIEPKILWFIWSSESLTESETLFELRKMFRRKELANLASQMSTLILIFFICIWEHFYSKIFMHKASREKWDSEIRIKYHKTVQKLYFKFDQFHKQAILN